MEHLDLTTILIGAGWTVVLFGFIFPWLSRQKINSQRLPIDAQETSTFSFYFPGKRVLALKYKVLEGAPVDVILTTTPSFDSDEPFVQHFADFAAMASPGGYRRITLPKGAYTLVMTPHRTLENAPSFVEVDVELAKPRPFQRAAQWTEFAVDRRVVGDQPAERNGQSGLVHHLHESY